MNLEELRSQCVHDVLTSRLPQTFRYKLSKRLGGRNLNAHLVNGERHYRGRHIRRTGRIELVDHKPVVLFHEVVHSIGGNEFDAEVFENFVYPETGIRPDGYYDKKEFEKSGYTGNFAYLHMDGSIRDTVTHTVLFDKHNALLLLRECLR